MRRWTGPRIVALFVGLFLASFGVWALVSPLTFYSQVATYPPYNTHLLHDIGAFQAGLGVTLLFTFFSTDAPLVVLLGVSVANVLHFVSHVVDRGLGGKRTDPLAVGVVAAITVAAALWRAAVVRRER